MIRVIGYGTVGGETFRISAFPQESRSARIAKEEEEVKQKG